ncbi:MAG: outer membrane lipid asymmetry maintenance protein MlaD [Rhodospirillaceae bacterium]|nr:outer membrane lipid asymmetry maintenance protein MlaD [Rhodospirillaceae bacterium]|tara:strand:+ start:2163 stop:2603 length:441 start_codon:yes stop_codon:yes gene_type:complete
MSRGVAETIMGGVVLAIAIAFIVFAYTRSSVATISGYEVSAKFTRIDGLVRGADVRVGGIKVGSVIGQNLDPLTYQAVVKMSISENIELPTDSTAAVVSDGLLGGKYVNLEPGGADEMMREGHIITYTQSSIMIDQLIGQFVFGSE